MNKLPFVWELNSSGVISHAIGTPHGLPVLFNSQFNKYTKDVIGFIEGKGIVLAEAEINEGGTIDAAVIDIARDRELPIREIASDEEREAFNDWCSVYMNSHGAYEAYKAGDENALKIIYGEPAKHLEPLNAKMAVGSIRWLKTAPSLMVANLARFIVQPSVLELYQQAGIESKRIQ